jgi:hypothetical protein
MFRRSRFGDLVSRQLDLFMSDHRDVLDDVDERRLAYNRAERSDAEELYGDYLDAVDTGIEILVDMRDRYARTLDDPDDYLRTFNRAVAKRLPEYALDIENR